MSKLIPLGKNGFAIVDDEDFDELSRYKWHRVRNSQSNTLFYARRFTSDSEQALGYPKHRYMHHQVLNTPPRQRVDHKNSDGLDNRRENLRPATHFQNMHNRRKNKTSRTTYKGVHSAKTGWTASILVDGKSVYLGLHRTQREAAIAYNAAATKYYGEFARLNVIPDQPDPDDQSLDREVPKTSPYRGVSRQQTSARWQAKFVYKNKIRYREFFSTEEDAAHAYDRAARQYLGDKAKLNFPD
jgi:hypothetical protein